MKRDEFLFTIGYQGNTAIVDGRSQRAYGRLTTAELAERGFFKPAFCSALYAGNEAEILDVLARYNQSTGSAYTRDGLNRLFGVFEVPRHITRIKVV